MPTQHELIHNEILKAAHILKKETDSKIQNGLRVWATPNIRIDNKNNIFFSKINLHHNEKTIDIPFDKKVKEYDMSIDIEALLIGVRRNELFDGIDFFYPTALATIELAQLSEDGLLEEVLSSVVPENEKEYGIMLKPSFFVEDSIHKLKGNIAKGFGAENFILVRVFDDMNQMYSKPVASQTSVIISGESYKYNRNNIFDIRGDDEVHIRHRYVVPKLIQRNISSQNISALKETISQLNIDSAERATKVLESGVEDNMISQVLTNERAKLIQNFKPKGKGQTFTP